MSVFGKWLYEIEKVDFYVKIDKKKKEKKSMGICGSSKQFRIVYFIGFFCLSNKLNKYIIVSKIINF